MPSGSLPQHRHQRKANVVVPDKSAKQSASDRNPKAPKSSSSKAVPRTPKTDEPKLLSSGNPQIPKGDGDAPVAAYIAAMPGWKSEVGRKLDALIVATVPNVAKAVKWNTPFYGNKDDGWFVCFYCYTKYVQVAFLRGTLLDPMPPGTSKTPETRYFKIYEDDEVATAQLASWIQQASQHPGEKL